MSFTNYIQQIKASNGTVHDIVDSSASHFIKGTQTASTNVWTGPLPDGVTAYYDGLTIDYFLPYAGTSTAATLNLGSLGAKPVYVGNSTSAVTTHFPQYAVIHLTYIINSALNSGNGCWKAAVYYNSNTTYSAGTGLSLSSTTFNHSNSITAGTAGTSSATSGSTLAVPYVTYDAQGHITATGTHTHTISGFLTSSSTLDATKLSGTIPAGCYTNTTYGIATNTTSGLVKPWYTHTAASTGPTTGNNTTAVAINEITTTASRYYAVEADNAGRLFVNVPWSDNNTNYYHTTGSWNGLTYTATANGGAGALAFTIPTGTSATTVAVGNHTHSYAASSSAGGSATTAATTADTTNALYPVGVTSSATTTLKRDTSITFTGGTISCSGLTVASVSHTITESQMTTLMSALSNI